jgi:hypothetical protein
MTERKKGEGVRRREGEEGGRGRREGEEGEGEGGGGREVVGKLMEK